MIITVIHSIAKHIQLFIPFRSLWCSFLTAPCRVTCQQKGVLYQSNECLCHTNVFVGPEMEWLWRELTAAKQSFLDLAGWIRCFHEDCWSPGHVAVMFLMGASSSRTSADGFG